MLYAANNQHAMRDFRIAADSGFGLTERACSSVTGLCLNRGEFLSLPQVGV